MRFVWTQSNQFQVVPPKPRPRRWFRHRGRMRCRECGHFMGNHGQAGCDWQRCRCPVPRRGVVKECEPGLKT